MLKRILFTFGFLLVTVPSSYADSYTFTGQGGLSGITAVRLNVE